MGARAWYLYFREYVSPVFEFDWCKEQPVLARETNGKFMLVLHVDDLLFVGDTKY